MSLAGEQRKMVRHKRRSRDKSGRYLTMEVKMMEPDTRVEAVEMSHVTKTTGIFYIFLQRKKEHMLM